MALGRRREMHLNCSDRHDVEDSSRVGVLGVGQFLVSRQVVIAPLNLSVHLASVCLFQVLSIVSMRPDGATDGRIS